MKSAVNQLRPYHNIVCNKAFISTGTTRRTSYEHIQFLYSPNKRVYSTTGVHVQTSVMISCVYLFLLICSYSISDLLNKLNFCLYTRMRVYWLFIGRYLDTLAPSKSNWK